MSQINKKWLEGVGQADGLAELDQDGVIPQQQLPAAVNNEPATRQAADEALSDRLDVLEGLRALAFEIADCVVVGIEPLLARHVDDAAGADRLRADHDARHPARRGRDAGAVHPGRGQPRAPPAALSGGRASCGGWRGAGRALLRRVP